MVQLQIVPTHVTAHFLFELTAYAFNTIIFYFTKYINNFIVMFEMVSCAYFVAFCLILQDFTLEQDSLRPANGWKAYYAATRAIININTEFFRILRDRSLPAMVQFWLNADYVKCFHVTGDSYCG